MYDVAISFLHGDEALARQIAERLVPLKTFVYMQRQEDVAGTDGAIKFREMFLNETRVAVVLHRARWGSTPFTRVEEAAIQELAMRGRAGWDHVFFVALEDAALPRWWPYARISLDYKTFGLDNLIGAVKAQLVRLGVAMQEPTAVQVAAATALREAFDKETEDKLHRSPNEFRGAVEQLFERLAEQATAIQDATKWEMRFGYNWENFIINGRGICMQLLPQQVYENTARDANVAVRLFKGYMLAPQDIGVRYYFDQPQEFSNKQLRIKRLPDVGWCWEWEGTVLPSAVVAEVLLKRFIDAGTQASKQGR